MDCTKRTVQFTSVHFVRSVRALREAKCQKGLVLEDPIPDVLSVNEGVCVRQHSARDKPSAPLAVNEVKILED